MKTLNVPFLSHLSQEVTTLAYLWKVVREDGAVYGFTSHDKPIEHDGITYEASAGFVPTTVDTGNGLAVDDVELEGAISSDAITQEDLLAGLWDRAEVTLYQVNYQDPSMGVNLLRRGWLGEVNAGTNNFVVELRGMNQRLAQQIGKSYSPICRANFCDNQCKLDLEDFQVTGSVTSVTDMRVFADSARTEADGYFNNGYITFTSGANNGLSREVKDYASNEITCELAFPFQIQAGDAYEMFRGCDKTLATCRDVYNNVVNFRGEPYIPNTDKQIEGPAR